MGNIALSLLPKKQMDAAVRSKGNYQLAILGKVDFTTRTLTLVYGDFSVHEATLDVFRPSGTYGTPSWCEPDFRDFEITDWGQAVRFGPYEAAVMHL
jgi:hypothetical protein